MALTFVPAGAAHAADPIDLGTAAPFSVLRASTVTNTGESVLNGDLGLSPETSITGFPPGIVNGAIHNTDEVAALAQGDLLEAYNVAAGLTPIATGLEDLTGQSLTPGVYSGGELSVTGALTLAGTAESVWVFQAASTLTIGSGSKITGTVMAYTSVTANTAATIAGRLLALNGAVTLDTNTFTPPNQCNESPEITTTELPTGQVGTDYSATITATGSPAPEYTVSDGALPAGVDLDGTTGVMSGQPTSAGDHEFSITARNGVASEDTEAFTMTVAPAAVIPPPTPAAEVGAAPEDRAAPLADAPAPVAHSSSGKLADSGVDVGFAPLLGLAALALGAALIVRSRRSAHTVAQRRRN